MKKNYASKIFLSFFAFHLLTIPTAFAHSSTHYITLLKNMFDQVAVAKNINAIPKYYSRDFQLSSNGMIMDYNQFVQQHRKIYQTPIQYKFRYDDETFVERGNEVAGRIFITTQRPNESPNEIEVILIAKYKHDKLYRVWEVTYPNWSQLKAFKNSK